MKANFEKGTKICSRCRKELPTSCFYKDKSKYENINAQGILIYYDGKLEDLDSKEYIRIMNMEYNRQRRCAINGYVGRTKRNNG